MFYTVNHETPDVFLADSCSMLVKPFCFYLEFMWL